MTARLPVDGLYLVPLKNTEQAALMPGSASRRSGFVTVSVAETMRQLERARAVSKVWPPVVVISRSPSIFDVGDET